MFAATEPKGDRSVAGTAATLFVCLLVAILEGLDLQSIGVAAPRMAREFGLTVGQTALTFSAGMLGLLPGALLGGILADRVGRKRVLLLSMLVFGAFSLGTAHVWGFPSLLVARFLTGLGLGGAMPNLIALSAEAVEPRSRNTAVCVMYCGMPFGGALAALLGVLSTGDDAWRNIFYAGGAGPIVIIPLLMLCLQESSAGGVEPARQHRLGTPALTLLTLFGGRRAVATLMLWVSFLSTLVVLYFLINWLPSLMGSRGLSRAQAGISQIFFNGGSVIGVLVTGVLMDRFRPARVVPGVYLLIIVSLGALSVAYGMVSISIAVFFAGAGVTGAQGMLYSMAAGCYPISMRGTGVGAAVAVGRFGAIMGPSLAGLLLSMGKSSAIVVGASVPVTVIAAVSASILAAGRHDLE